MANPQYVKGRKKEYRIKRELEALGYTVLRTAGSHGFADLIAIGNSFIRFIQCKPDSMSEKEKEKLMKENSLYNKSYRWHTTFEVI